MPRNQITVGKATITQQRFPSNIPHTSSRFEFLDVTGALRLIQDDTGNVSRMIEVMLEGSGEPQPPNQRTDFNNDTKTEDQAG